MHLTRTNKESHKGESWDENLLALPGTTNSRLSSSILSGLRTLTRFSYKKEMDVRTKGSQIQRQMGISEYVINAITANPLWVKKSEGPFGYERNKKTRACVRTPERNLFVE